MFNAQITTRRQTSGAQTSKARPADNQCKHNRSDVHLHHSHGDGGADIECTIITHVVYEQDNQCARVRRYFSLCIFYFFLMAKKKKLLAGPGINELVNWESS